MPKRNERMEHLAERIAELARRDTEMKTFGATPAWGGHEYRLNPCLKVEELAWFQREYDVRLPQDYADFLTQIGNGGVGPYYGLFSLLESVSDNPEHKCRAFLARPFPLTEYFNSYGREESETEEETFFDPCIAGSVALSHQGCGYYDLLIISGPHAGEVWTDGRVSDQGIAPLNCDFYTWYDQWLTESLSEL